MISRNSGDCRCISHQTCTANYCGCCLPNDLSVAFKRDDVLDRSAEHFQFVDQRQQNTRQQELNIPNNNNCSPFEVLSQLPKSVVIDEQTIQDSGSDNGDYWWVNSTKRASPDAYEQTNRQHNKELLRHQSEYYGANLQPFVIYENICQSCVYGYGCYCSKSDKPLLPVSVTNIFDVNTYTATATIPDSKCYDTIYENICNICSHTCSDDNSNVCMCRLPNDVDETLLTNRQINKYSKLLKSLRQRIRKRIPKKSQSFSATPRPHIVRNIEQAYNTNHTFDLDEIIRLRRGQLCVSEDSDNGDSSTVFSNNNKQPYDEFCANDVHSSGNSVRASNDKCLTTQRLDSSSLPNLRVPLSPRASFNTVHSPTYENLPQTKNTSLITLVTQSADINPQQSSFLSTASLIDVHISSLENWMTSLRRQTHDYGDESKSIGCVVKCIPSDFVSCCEYTHCGATQTMYNCVNNNSSELRDTTSSTGTDVCARIDKFRANYKEYRSKKRNEQIVEWDTLPLVPQTLTIPISSDLNVIVKVTGKELLNAAKWCPLDTAIAMNYVKNCESQRHLPAHIDKNIEVPFENLTVIAQLEKCPRLGTSNTFDIPAILSSQHASAIINTQMVDKTGLHRSTIILDNKCSYVSFKLLMNKLHGNNQQQSHKHMNGTVQHNDDKMSNTKESREQSEITVTHIEEIKISDFDVELAHNQCSIRASTSNADVSLLASSREGADSADSADYENISYSNELTNDSTVGLTATNMTEDSQLSNWNVIEYLNKPPNDDLRVCPTSHSYHTGASQADADYLLQMGNKSKSSVNAKYQEQGQRIKFQNSEPKGIPSMTIDQINANVECIYQPIWEFKTVGSTRESDVSFVSEYYSASEFCEEVCDVAEWEVAEEEFAFASERISQLADYIDCSDIISCKDDQCNTNTDCGIYRNVCILYHHNQPIYNRIFYDNNGQHLMAGEVFSNASGGAIDIGIDTSSTFDPFPIANDNRADAKRSDSAVYKADSVHSWKRLLRSMAYTEDEEDMVSSM